MTVHDEPNARCDPVSLAASQYAEKNWVQKNTNFHYLDWGYLDEGNAPHGLHCVYLNSDPKCTQPGPTEWKDNVQFRPDVPHILATFNGLLWYKDVIGFNGVAGSCDGRTCMDINYEPISGTTSTTCCSNCNTNLDRYCCDTTKEGFRKERYNAKVCGAKGENVLYSNIVLTCGDNGKKTTSHVTWVDRGTLLCGTPDELNTVTNLAPVENGTLRLKISNWSMTPITSSFATPKSANEPYDGKVTFTVGFCTDDGPAYITSKTCQDLSWLNDLRNGTTNSLPQGLPERFGNYISVAVCVYLVVRDFYCQLFRESNTDSYALKPFQILNKDSTVFWAAKTPNASVVQNYLRPLYEELCRIGALPEDSRQKKIPEWQNFQQLVALPQPYSENNKHYVTFRVPFAEYQAATYKSQLAGSLMSKLLSEDKMSYRDGSKDMTVSPCKFSNPTKVLYTVISTSTGAVATQTTVPATYDPYGKTDDVFIVDVSFTCQVVTWSPMLMLYFNSVNPQSITVPVDGSAAKQVCSKMRQDTGGIFPVACFNNTVFKGSLYQTVINTCRISMSDPHQLLPSAPTDFLLLNGNGNCACNGTLETEKTSDPSKAAIDANICFRTECSNQTDLRSWLLEERGLTGQCNKSCNYIKNLYNSGQMQVGLVDEQMTHKVCHTSTKCGAGSFSCGDKFDWTIAAGGGVVALTAAAALVSTRRYMLAVVALVVMSALACASSWMLAGNSMLVEDAHSRSLKSECFSKTVPWLPLPSNGFRIPDTFCAVHSKAECISNEDCASTGCALCMTGVCTADTGQTYHPASPQYVTQIPYRAVGVLVPLAFIVTITAVWHVRNRGKEGGSSSIATAIAVILALVVDVGSVGGIYALLRYHRREVVSPGTCRPTASQHDSRRSP